MKGGGKDGLGGSGGGGGGSAIAKTNISADVLGNNQDANTNAAACTTSHGTGTGINSAADDATGTCTDMSSARAMASMSGFAPTATSNNTYNNDVSTFGSAGRSAASMSTTSISTGTGISTTGTTMRAGAQSMPGAYAVPGIYSTTTSSSTPNDGTAAAGASAREQIRRLSSRTRLHVLSSLLSGGGGGGAGPNGSNSALISSLVGDTDVVVAEATLVMDAEAVRASEASPDILIGEDVLDDTRNTNGDDHGDEEVGYSVGGGDASASDAGNNNGAENVRRSFVTREDETHTTDVAGSVPTMVTAVPEEEFMQGKHIFSRRGIIFLVAGFLVLLGIALGVAIPLSRRISGSTTAPEKEPDLSEVLTYAPEAICYSHIPLMTDLSRVCTDPSTLPKGGPFCQLVTDGILAQLHHVYRGQLLVLQEDDVSGRQVDINIPKVDMVITNAGAQRGDILSDTNVTLGTIQQNLPFLSNKIVILEVSPFDIHQSLEGGLNYTLQAIPIKVSFSAGYPYAANLRFDIDLTQPYGQRVSNMEVWRGNEIENADEGTGGDAENDGGGDGMSAGSWALLDRTDTTTKYVAATNSYLAGGGDQYFRTVPEEAKTMLSDLGFTDTFAEYCRSVDVLLGPDLEAMSTQDFVPLEEY